MSFYASESFESSPSSQDSHFFIGKYPVLKHVQTEQEHQEENSVKLHIATRAINTSVGTVQRYFPPTRATEYYAEHSHTLFEKIEMSDHLLRTLKNLLSPSINLNDYFRLATAQDFVVESVAAPTAFIDNRGESIRNDLVDGSAGKSVARLEQAINISDRKMSNNKRGELMGVIAELTFLSLANYRQIPNRLVLPATLNDDRHNRTDAYIYHLDVDKGYGRRTPVQVKSGMNKCSSDQPDGGFIINGRYLRPDPLHFPDIAAMDDQFYLQKALIQEFSGELISEQQSLVIKYSVEKLHNKITQELARKPGFRIPQYWG